MNFPGERGIVRYLEELFVGYRYYDKKKQEVQFPFGYGLSYTQFAYRNLVLGKSQINDTESLRLHFQVKNTGTRKGKEIMKQSCMIGTSRKEPIR